jgi:hypothetical protein
MFSALNGFVHREGYSVERAPDSYAVETVSLNDLLVQHDAPQQIDYLSVDTEGTEFRILAAFDFERWNVRLLTVEHNYDVSRRSAIGDLLDSQGFERVLPDLSMWEDWYVRR